MESRLFQNFSFWKSNLRFTGKTRALAGFSTASSETNGVLEEAKSQSSGFNMTIKQMASAMKKKELSSAELVSNYLGEIEKRKDLNAIMEINPDALAIAEKLDSSVDGDREVPLFGVPILLKDNICTNDKMSTSAGSLALKDNKAPYDAHIVRRLRKAGALILGKTNLTEFSNYMAKDMPNGYSSRGGQTLNVCDPAIDPSGSSTGSAVAVAAGLCAAAIGTETCGSIISPAQHAGIVGLKPGGGILSAEGIVPISFTLDTAGPLCRCVEDAALMLSVLSGSSFNINNGANLKGLRIGVCRTPMGKEYGEEWIKLNLDLIPQMESLGAVCVNIPDHQIKTRFFLPLMQYEFKYAINSFLKTMTSAIPKTLKGIIAFNNANPELALRYGQDILLTAEEASGTMTESEYINAMAGREKAIKDLDTLFDENNIDILFMTEGDFSIAASTGFPSMTAPLGYNSKGHAIGSFFVAKRSCEELLLNAAYAIEQAR